MSSTDQDPNQGTPITLKIDGAPGQDPLYIQTMVPYAESLNAKTAANWLAGEITNYKQINSLADLKRKWPKFWKGMMESIAMNMCRQSQRHQDRLTQMWRKFRE